MVAERAHQWLHGARADVLAAGWALALAFAYLLEVGGDPLVRVPILDLWQYEELARQMASGTFPEKAFFVDPLYIVLRAVLIFAFGEGRGAPLAVNLIALAAAGIAMRRLGARVAGAGAGMLAAVALPLCRPVLFPVVLPMKELLALALLLWCLVSLAAYLDEGRAWRLCVSGLLLGLAVLTRGNLLIVSPVLGFAVLLRPAGSFARRFCEASLLAACTILPIAPVTAWNARASGEFVLVTYNLGNNFYQGNNPIHQSTDFFNPPFVRDNPAFEEHDWRVEMLKRLRERGQIAQPSPDEVGPSELSGFWLAEGWGHVRKEPAAFVQRTGAKLLRLLSSSEITNNVPVEYLAEHSLLLRFGTYPFGWLVLLGLPAWVLAWPRMRHRRWLLACGLLYAVGVSVFYLISRLKIPLAPFLALPVASAVVLVARRELGDRRRLVTAAATAVLAAIIGLWSYPQRVGLGEYNLGVVLAKDGDRAGAEAAYRDSISKNPEFAPSRVNLARMLADRDALDEAIAAARGAVSANPGHAPARAIMGELLLRSGRTKEAEIELSKAVELGNSWPEVRLNLGLALARGGQEARAVEHFWAAYNGGGGPRAAEMMATALLNLGRAGDAVAFLEQAVRRFPEHRGLAGLLAEARRRLGR
jgi:4-amino-4-deoxy-L-arabinose transferase-like glycosyltransferase